MGLKSYTAEMFYLVCDKCGVETDAIDDKMEVIERASIDGWEIECLTPSYRVLRSVCPVCSGKEEE